MKKPQPKHIVMAALFAACALVLVFTHHDADDELVEATPRPAQPASRKPRRAAPMPNAAPSRSPRSARAPSAATPAPTRCSTR